MADKTYINGLFIKEKQFPNGGFILKASIKAENVDSLCAQLKAAAKPDGWINLDLSKNMKTKQDAKGNEVQYWGISVDTWGADKSPAAKSPWD